MTEEIQYSLFTSEIKENMRIFYNALNEKDRRRYAALEALKLGYGGQKYICEILKCSMSTIQLGIDEIHEGSKVPDKNIRIPNAGAKKIVEKIENIDEIFLDIVKENTAGSPMNEDLKWTSLQLKEISNRFKERGYLVSEYVVKQLLEKHKYVKRKMVKDKTYKTVENRDEQFKNIDKLKEEYRTQNNPIVSIDVKKKRS